MEGLIGDLPDGWRQISLGETCDVLAGPSDAKLRPGIGKVPGVPLIVPRHIKNNRIASENLDVVESAIAEKLSRYRLAPGDVVCTRTGNPGRHALIEDGQNGWLFGTACLRLRPNQLINARYLNLYLDHLVVRDWIARNSSGSAIQSVSSATVRAMPIVVPPHAVQAAIGQVITALDEKIALHTEIARTTSALRESLLPSLISGSFPISAPRQRSPL